MYPADQTELKSSLSFGSLVMTSSLRLLCLSTFVSLFLCCGSVNAALEAKQTPERIELEFWRAIEDSEDAAEFEAYLEAYPEGKFAALARVRARKFRKTSDSSPATQDQATDESAVPSAGIDAISSTAVDTETTASASAAGADGAEGSVKTEEDKQSTDVIEGVYRDCGLCPEIVDVPAGAFVMKGDGDGASGKEITFASDFSIARLEVTVREWQFCVDQGRCKENSRHADLPADTPATNLSWADANDYVDWISEFTSFQYRLPTEAEWEYVARGGSSSVYWWNDNDAAGNANCRDCGADWNKNHPTTATGLNANEFGVVGTLGGVSEWVQDCWNLNNSDIGENGAARLEGDCSQRVLRGGSWRHTVDKITVASRASYDATVRYVTNGFRIVRDRDFD